MVKKYVMALDAGTTSNRAIIFDEDSKIIGVSQKEFTQYFPHDGWVEHDADEIWSSMLLVMKEALEQGFFCYEKSPQQTVFKPKLVGFSSIILIYSSYEVTETYSRGQTHLPLNLPAVKPRPYPSRCSASIRPPAFAARIRGS